MGTNTRSISRWINQSIRQNQIQQNPLNGDVFGKNKNGNNNNDNQDPSRSSPYRREDYLNQRAKDLEKATDELRREFNKRDLWIENKDEVRKCLNIAEDINVALKNRKLSGATESNWANVRYELNTLAKIYNLPNIK